MSSKFSHEDALEYLKQWINEEDWDDFQQMYNFGDAELMSDALVSAGAIDSSACYDYAKPIEKYIENLAKKFRARSESYQKKQYDKMLAGVITIDCQDCNHVSFVADRNETLYPEVLERCWTCKSTNIQIEKPKGKK